MCDLLPFAVAHDLRLFAAERLHRRTARAAQARAARRVDVVPRAAELNGCQPLGEVEPVVVERRDDDPLRRAVAPAPVFDEEFGRFGLRPAPGGGFLPDRFGEQLRKSEEPQGGCREQLRDAVLNGHAAFFEQRERLPVGRVGGDPLGRVQQSVGASVTVPERRVLGQRVQRRRDQRRGVVVDPFVEVGRRAGRVLVGRRAQFGADLPGEGGQVRGVEVDRAERAVVADDDILGFQVAVGAVVRDQREGQPVEQPDEDLQTLAVPEGGGLRHGFVQGGAFDPVAEDRIDPDAGFGRGVQVKLLFEKPLAVDLLQVAHRAQVTAQRADASAEADAEYGGGVAGAEAGAALFVAAHVDFTQRARQAAGVEKSQQVLTEGKHVAGIGFLASSDLSETAQVTKIR